MRVGDWGRRVDLEGGFEGWRLGTEGRFEGFMWWSVGTEDWN